MPASRPWLAPAVLLVLLASGVPVAEADPMPTRVEKPLPHLVRDTLRETDRDAAHLLRDARGPVPRPLLPAPARDALEPLALLTQPAVGGRDDLLAALWVAPTGASWSGAYWVDSEAGAVAPRQVTFGREGALLTLYGGALATGEGLHVTFHFLGPNRTVWSLEAPRIAVLDATPARDHVGFGGAVATSHGRPDLPELAFLTPWNVLDAPTEMGFTLLRDNGSQVERVAVGGCADPEAPESERGCRPLYVVPRRDVETVRVWGNGAEAPGDLTLRLDDLATKPYVFPTVTR